MATDADYIAKVTQQHDQKPNFVATVTASVNPFVQIQEVLRQIQIVFNVDTAIGSQLDVIGEWVGASRTVPVPITGVFFSWEDSAQTGWGAGIWIGEGNSSNELSLLDDDDYRAMIKGKIEANRWDGTIPGAYRTLDAAFGVTAGIRIHDNQNMSQTVKVPSGSLNTIQRALISQGMLNIKPAGVSQTVTTA